MSLTFSEKYKPRYLNDFNLSHEMEHLLETLTHNNDMNILFIGEHGTGKTCLIETLLRNYYETTEYKNNVLEINNLHEQGIQYYREDVKTFCQTSFINSKKKTIIIDDLDTINENSQQVFINMMDKYKVQFICSCSNPQQVIENIKSRLFNINIPVFSEEKLTRIMQLICMNENIVVDKNVEPFLIKISNNSIRLLKKYLEKLFLLNIKKNVTLDIALECCTSISFHTLDDYITFCKNKEMVKAIELILSISDLGFSPIDIYENLSLFVETTNNIDERIKFKLIELICKYITLFYNIHEHNIELVLLTREIVFLF